MTGIPFFSLSQRIHCACGSLLYQPLQRSTLERRIAQLSHDVKISLSFVPIPSSVSLYQSFWHGAICNPCSQALALCCGPNQPTLSHRHCSVSVNCIFCISVLIIAKVRFFTCWSRVHLPLQQVCPCSSLAFVRVFFFTSKTLLRKLFS